MQHLSEREILDWQLNEQPLEVRQHVAECAGCRDQVSNLESSLSLYRESVHGWSDAHQSRVRRPVWSTPSRWQLWRRATFQWATAAVLALAVVVPVYTHRVMEERKEQRAKADQALLEQVDREVSQTIPDTMEPLTQLVQWEPGDSSDTDSSTQKGRRQ